MQNCKADCLVLSIRICLHSRKLIQRSSIVCALFVFQCGSVHGDGFGSPCFRTVGVISAFYLLQGWGMLFQLGLSVLMIRNSSRLSIIVIAIIFLELKNPIHQKNIIFHLTFISNCFLSSDLRSSLADASTLLSEHELPASRRRAESAESTSFRLG